MNLHPQSKPNEQNAPHGVRYLLHATALCVESGDLPDWPCFELFDEADRAVQSFCERLAAAKKSIEREIGVINSPANHLTFSAPYIYHAAVFLVPHEMDSVESAIAWISEQLEKESDLSKAVVRYEGASIDATGEKNIELQDYLQDW
jgi:hypothetical protein